MLSEGSCGDKTETRVQVVESAGVKETAEAEMCVCMCVCVHACARVLTYFEGQEEPRMVCHVFTPQVLALVKK